MKWNSTAPGGKWAGNKLHAYATNKTVAKDRDGKFIQRVGMGWHGEGMHPGNNPDDAFTIVNWG